MRVTRLAGVYSNPHQVPVYPDGNQVHIVVLNFEVELVRGEPGLSDETTAEAWFPVRKAVKMELFHGHSERIRDALTGQDAAFIR